MLIKIITTYNKKPNKTLNCIFSQYNMNFPCKVIQLDLYYLHY